MKQSQNIILNLNPITCFQTVTKKFDRQVLEINRLVKVSDSTDPLCHIIILSGFLEIIFPP